MTFSNYKETELLINWQFELFIFIFVRSLIILFCTFTVMKTKVGLNPHSQRKEGEFVR